MDLVGILNEFLPKLNATIENWIPREVNEITLKSLAGPQRYECDILSLNQGLFSPIWEILDRGGKRWRSFLILLIAEILGCDIEKVLDFAVITEIIHNGTLIIDDIEDDSEFRRGKPCLHKLSGIDVAVNAGNGIYLISALFQATFENRTLCFEQCIFYLFEYCRQKELNFPQIYY